MFASYLRCSRLAGNLYGIQCLVHTSCKYELILPDKFRHLLSLVRRTSDEMCYKIPPFFVKCFVGFLEPLEYCRETLADCPRVWSEQALSLRLMSALPTPPPFVEG
jgi:hypothetical protein